MAQLGAAVIGLGMMGQRHSRVWAELPTTRLVSVYDIVPERTREVAEQYGCLAAGSVEEAISAGRAMAERLATQRAIAAGAGNPAARTEIDRRTVRIADGSLQLVEVRISATAAGRPTLTPVARAD